MADSKTSGLSALGEAPASGDLVEIVDVSDTSMAATGTNKKITVSNFLSGVATIPRHLFAHAFEDVGTDTNRFAFATTGSGAVSNSEGGVQIATGTTDGSRASVQATFATNTAPAESIYSRNPSFGAIGRLTSSTTGAFVAQACFGLNNFADGSGNITNKHFGFILDSATLYASNANGTTQTKTDVSSGITVTDINTYACVMASGTSIKFYIVINVL